MTTVTDFSYTAERIGDGIVTAPEDMTNDQDCEELFDE